MSRCGTPGHVAGVRDALRVAPLPRLTAGGGGLQVPAIFDKDRSDETRQALTVSNDLFPAAGHSLKLGRDN